MPRFMMAPSITAAIMRPRVVPLLALLGLLTAALPGAPASTAAAPPQLRVGDAATYELTLADPALSMTAAVRVGGAEACRDGFNRTFACHLVEVTHSVPPRILNRTLPYHLSLAHAEFVGWGSWALDGRTHQEVFASDSPHWQGSPYPAQPGATASYSRGVKVVLVGALVASAKASTGATGATRVADQPGTIAVSSNATARTVELSFGAGGNATAEPPVRYVATFGVGESLPASVVVERNGTVVATATRTAFAAGTQPISFAVATPLDFPAHPHGKPLKSWTSAPPSRSNGFYYPFRDAYAVESVTPQAIAFAVQRPGQYVTTAGFAETVDDHTSTGVRTRTGTWTIVHADGTAAVRVATARRVGPDAARDVHEDVVLEGQPGGWQRTYTPARADLPAQAFTFEDALDVAKAHVPLHKDAFFGQFFVPQVPGLGHTADAMYYYVQCGVVEGGWSSFLVFVSAVNGQVLSRIGDGSAACVPDGADAAAAESAPRAPALPLRDALEP